AAISQQARARNEHEIQSAGPLLFVRLRSYQHGGRAVTDSSPTWILSSDCNAIWRAMHVPCLDIPVLQGIEALPDGSASVPVLPVLSARISHPRRPLASYRLSMSHVRW